MDLPQIDPRLADIGQQQDGQVKNEAQHQPAHQDNQQYHQPQLQHAQQHQQHQGSLESLASQAHQLPQLYHGAYGASPQQNYPQQPLTPQQLGNSLYDNVPQTGSDGGQHMQQQSTAPNQSGATPEDTKRPRACEACRGLKVKCEFDPNNHDGPCKRCTKAHRNCVVTQPSRKRQKKTDSRVAELEKKLNALSQVLERSQAAGAVEADIMGTGTMNKPQHPYDQMASYAYGTHYAGRAEGNIGSGSPWPSATPSEFQQPYPRQSEPVRTENADLHRSSIEKLGISPIDKPSMVVAGQKRKLQDMTENASTVAEHGSVQGLAPGPAATVKPTGPNEYSDVIDRGLLSVELANSLFERYVNEMAPHMPSVIFPSGTTSSDIRKTKPVLFLAIIAVGASTNHPDLANVLNKEVLQVYADRILVRGEKSLEIIQALIVSSIWYWPPEHFEEVKFYQLVHLAATMAQEIGIHKKAKPGALSNQRSMAGLWNWKRGSTTDGSSIEARRTWMTCYFLCCNSATGLRRPNMTHWSPYLAECVEVLETSPLAAQSDKTLCQWIKTQHIMEKVANEFDMYNDSAMVNIADPQISNAVEGFQRELGQWTESVPREIQSPLLKMSEHIVNLFIHEIALNFENKPPSPGQTPDQEQAPLLTPAHINALSTCLVSIDAIFEAFLAMDVESIRTLPVMHVVRIAYAVVVLIKMYFQAITPGSEFGKAINADNMKVEQYLDQLFHKFKEITSDEKSRSGSKFLMVLVMIRTCLHRQKAGSAANSGPASNAEITDGGKQQQDGNAPKQDQQGQQQKPDYDSSNTPLQLLSEVATGTASNTAAPRTDGKYDTRTPYLPIPWTQWDQSQSGTSTPTLQQQQQQGQSTPGGVNGNNAYAIDPSLNQPAAGTSSQGIGNGGLEYYQPINNGLEQAMGMTLGEGDLSQWFGDEAYQAFLKAMMDGNGMGGGFEDYAFL